MENKTLYEGRLQELKARAKRCCCKYCGGALELRRIVFMDDEDARVELFCSQCDRMEYGVEPEIYRNALQFVTRFHFNHYPDLNENELTKRMNVAKVCEIMTWGDKKLGILTNGGFTTPVDAAPDIIQGGLLLTRDMLRDKEGKV